MYNLFTLHSLYYFLVYVALFSFYGLLTGAFSKKARENKKDFRLSMALLIFITILTHVGTWIYSEHSRQSNQEVCDNNVTQGYKMRGNVCYRPALPGEYLQYDTLATKL